MESGTSIPPTSASPPLTHRWPTSPDRGRSGPAIGARPATPRLRARSRAQAPSLTRSPPGQRTPGSPSNSRESELARHAGITRAGARRLQPVHTARTNPAAPDRTGKRSHDGVSARTTALRTKQLSDGAHSPTSCSPQAHTRRTKGLARPLFGALTEGRGAASIKAATTPSMSALPLQA